MSIFRRASSIASQKNNDNGDDSDVIIDKTSNKQQKKQQQQQNYYFEAYLVKNEDHDDNNKTNDDGETTTTTNERIIIRHSSKSTTATTSIPTTTSNTIPPSPREWMERRGIEGAYTVIRSELILRDDQTLSSSVWGYPFHANRLRSSYRNVVSKNNTTNFDSCLDEASVESRLIVNALLSEYKKCLLSGRRSDDDDGDDDDNKRVETTRDNDDNHHVVMLTLLWTPSSSLSTSTDRSSSSSYSAIDVRGHACRSTVSSFAGQSPPSPITVTLALDRHNSDDDDDDITSQHRRPNRYTHHPDSKLSSWCWRRRPLEEDFSHFGQNERAGEVLLLRRRTRRHGNNDDDDWKVLEGLTSNVFFVYNDGRIRTASRRGGVLGGYARQLVLNYLKRRRRRDGGGGGERLLSSLLEGSETEDDDDEEEEGVILLKDAAQWKEIFLTSAMKLIVPVNKVLMVAEDHDKRDGNGDDVDCEIGFKEIWSTTACDDEDTATPQQWKTIRDDILKQGGDDWVL